MATKKEIAKKVSKVAVLNWQPILIGTGVLVGVYLLYKIVKKTGDAVDGAGDAVIDIFKGDPNAGGGNVNTGGNQPPPPNSNQSITQNQAQTIAAGLYQAMAQWGTDEERIFNLLRGKTPQDYTLISNAFGSPRYDGVAEAYFPFPKKNLTYWLNNELGETDMQHLKTIALGIF